MFGGGFCNVYPRKCDPILSFRVLSFIYSINKQIWKKSNYIRFDWAIKRLLRQKANFVVLESFLSSLLNETVRIERILESEGNKDTEDDKFNRLDMLAG
jgi:hypothetical protein